MQLFGLSYAGQRSVEIAYVAALMAFVPVSQSTETVP